MPEFNRIEQDAKILWQNAVRQLPTLSCVQDAANGDSKLNMAGPCEHYLVRTHLEGHTAYHIHTDREHSVLMDH